MHDRRRQRGTGPRRLYVQEPAEVIRRVTLAARFSPASGTYRRLMTVIDAALFTRDDYGELTQLAAAVEHDQKGHR
ncbi:MAG: hypothetical protein GEV07_25920 [Streptosporangiales bacterium]|nr:hypothetical protein [Streptosporangiales bacterium]